MDRITVAIVAKDEAENLRQLLPVLGWAHQTVVVVDARSQDATAEVAQEHGSRVLIRWFDTYAGQRNAALEMAEGDWVFWLDADERPAPGLVRELQERVGPARVHGFRVPIRSWIFRRRLRWSGTQDDRPVRLIRRGWGRWEGAVHERLRVRGRVETLQHGLCHWSTQDLDTYLAKMHWYACLESHGRMAAGVAPRRLESWWAPIRETLRRLCWKGGILDGPAGWAFCLLSGLGAWVAARQYQHLWQATLSGFVPGSEAEMAREAVRPLLW